ncbi:MAG: hypothetical protein ACFB4I_05245 [Cyanophyceae cyanobacterium]
MFERALIFSALFALIGFAWAVNSYYQHLEEQNSLNRLSLASNTVAERRG